MVYSELSTPLSTVAYTGAEQGGVYGLEPSPRRFLSTSLRAKTPVPGLYLTGQDVGGAGITGVFARIAEGAVAGRAPRPYAALSRSDADAAPPSS